MRVRDTGTRARGASCVHGPATSQINDMEYRCECETQARVRGYLETPSMTAVKTDPHRLFSPPIRDLPCRGSPEVNRTPEMYAVSDFISVPTNISNTDMSPRRSFRHKIISASCCGVGINGFAKPCTLHEWCE